MYWCYLIPFTLIFLHKTPRYHWIIDIQESNVFASYMTDMYEYMYELWWLQLIFYLFLPHSMSWLAHGVCQCDETYAAMQNLLDSFTAHDGKNSLEQNSHCHHYFQLHICIMNVITLCISSLFDWHDFIWDYSMDKKLQLIVFWGIITHLCPNFNCCSDNQGWI